MHRHAPDAYEVEFTESDGTTEDFLALHTDQFIVVWRAETGKTVPVSEQISALVTRLPEDVAEEVLDFARFLSAKKQVTDYLSTPGQHLGTGFRNRVNPDAS